VDTVLTTLDRLPGPIEPPAADEPTRAGRDLYEAVLNGITEELEKGVVPWARPWGVHHNVVTKTRYQLFNAFWLTLMSEQLGVTHSGWLTPNQLAANGGRPKAGAKPAFGLHWFTRYSKVPVIGVDSRDGASHGRSGGSSKVERKDEEFRVVYSKGPAIKLFLVYNMEQVEGLPARFMKRLDEVPADGCRAAALVEGSGAKLTHEGNRACYVPKADTITMPPFREFVDSQSYYSTLLHELVHWTGHEKRLKRDFSLKFGSQGYAREELVAELGAAFLCALLGVRGKLRHAEYIASWLKVLRADPGALLQAGMDAGKAVRYLEALAPGWTWEGTKRPPKVKKPRKGRGRA